MSKLLLLSFLAILPLPMVHAQGTPLLFLGPGKYSSGKSEVFSLPAQGGNLSTASCTVPDYPVTDIEGYVPFVQDGYLQLCGGFSRLSSDLFLSSCYVLRDSAWVATTPLSSARAVAAATTLHNGSVLIFGGQTTHGTRLSSSEILTGTTWAPALELPSTRSRHCMIGLSTGEIFLHGGYSSDSVAVSDTYLSTDLTSWQTRASSKIYRYGYSCACTEVTRGTEQEVWVGGAGTTEIYSVATDTWRTGPSLPSAENYPGEFVSYNGQLYHTEGCPPAKNIYQLKDGWTQEDGWEKIGEMTGRRLYYQAMIISQDMCEGLGKKKTKQTPLPSSTH